MVALSGIYAAVYELTGEVTPSCPAMTAAAIASSFDYIDCAIVGITGTDLFGKLLHDTALALSIDTGGLHAAPHALTGRMRAFLDKNGNRYFMGESYAFGVNDNYLFRSEDIRRIVAADYVLAQGGTYGMRQVLDLKRYAGFKLAVDWQDYANYSFIESALPRVDFSFFSAEGREVDEMQNRLKRWSKRFPTCFVMTMAERGSVAYKDGIEYSAAAISVDRVVDTAGCGDSYFTAFMCSFAKDENITTAMEAGHRMAAKCLSHHGAIEHEGFYL